MNKRKKDDAENGVGTTPGAADYGYDPPPTLVGAYRPDTRDRLCKPIRMLVDGKTDLFKNRGGNRKRPRRGSIGRKKSRQKRRKEFKRTFKRVDRRKESFFVEISSTTKGGIRTQTTFARPEKSSTVTATADAVVKEKILEKPRKVNGSIFF